MNTNSIAHNAGTQQAQHAPDSGRAHNKLIQDTLELFAPTGGVFEVRILGAERAGTVSGYFDDAAQAAQAVLRWDGRADAVYVTLNQVQQEAIHRSYNKLKPYAKNLTTDSEIVRRRWLLLDGDPQRLAGISSNDAEHAAALAWCLRVRQALSQEGWPEPVVADSGNGGHLLYPIDLPNDVESKRLVQQLLKALAARFDDPPDAYPRVKLDTTVHNAARITKLYGTLVQKGTDTAERPHRRSRLLQVPPALQTTAATTECDVEVAQRELQDKAEEVDAAEEAEVTA